MKRRRDIHVPLPHTQILVKQKIQSVITRHPRAFSIFASTNEYKKIKFEIVEIIVAHLSASRLSNCSFGECAGGWRRGRAEWEHQFISAIHFVLFLSLIWSWAYQIYRFRRRLKHKMREFNVEIFNRFASRWTNDVKLYLKISRTAIAIASPTEWDQT